MGKTSITLYLGRPKKILLFLGLWLPPENLFSLQTVYMILILLSQYSFILFQIIYIGGVWGDMDEVSEASYLLFSQASLCFKVTAFLINKDKLLQLLAFMEQELFQPQSAHHEKLLKDQARRIMRFSAVLLTGTLSTCTLCCMIPLFDDSRKRTYSFKIWMPVQPGKSPGYELGYIYQTVTIYISASLFSAVDIVALSMIMFGCAQLDIIMDKIQQVKNIPLKVKENERDDLLKFNNSLLVECIKQHQDVVRFIEIIENTYNYNIFFQLCGTVASICIIGLRITTMDLMSVQFFSMLVYLISVLSQLFFYCWCGSELTTRSEHLRESLYQCFWYEQNVQFRRMLWIAMERMKRPIIFRAGYYITLSRPTFVAILRCSYSYFAVLNSTDN